MRQIHSAGKKCKMRAVVLTRTCTPEELEVVDVPIPEVKPGWVLVKIKAFGLNHSEAILRRSEANAPYIKLPRIPGIECVGEVLDAYGSPYKIGQRVCALMGGMGRSFDGSYAEYALLPEQNVFAVETDLDWNEMAAIPETWFTAWASLFDCLQLTSQDTLLIRGGTSALGIAAIQIAKSIGSTVFATTRKSERLEYLLACGAIPLLDQGNLLEQLRTAEIYSIQKVLELVGPVTLEESLRLVQYHGIVCSTGILGNKATISEFDPIKSIPNGVYLSSFYSNFPTQLVISEIFHFIHSHQIKPVISGIFPLEEISKAHRLMEDSAAIGKLVVSVSND
jgi:NADPH:quinone reductase-like Zn-dependent oxidoreductase